MHLAGVDCHCHLDLYKDPRSVLENLSDAAISTFAVTTTPRSFNGNLERFGRSSLVKVGLGIHPELAHTREADLQMFKELLPNTNLVGEVGLDGRPKNRTTFSKQLAVFGEVLETVQTSSQPRVLSIHSAGAVTSVLDHLEPLANTRIKTILHWFAGTPEELRRAVALNFYFSVNPAMLGTAHGRHLARSVPLERLLTETDGPFTCISGRPSTPSDVLHVADAIAKERQLGGADAREVLLKNALRIFDDL